MVYSHNTTMIELPTQKKWTGEGWASNTRLLTQIKRSLHNAIYRVSDHKTGKATGFEVFKIRILPKGTRIFDTVTTDDEEKYPTGEQFGHTAWYAASQSQAEKIFDTLEAEKHLGESTVNPSECVSPEPKTNSDTAVHKNCSLKGISIKLPNGEFKMQDVAELNNMGKANVYVIVQEFIASGKVRETRRVSQGRGRPTVMYQEVSH